MKIFDVTVSFWRDRLKASAIHLLLSCALALLAGLLVFVVWYPFPYREISGGRELFLLVVSVDVVLGPLITLAIFDRRKAYPVLKRDFQVIAIVQLAALAYGLWTVFVARPVHMVFEYDRFRVVHAIEIDPVLLAKAPSTVSALPITGPTLMALRPFRDDTERTEATMAALQSVSLAVRADLWEPYENARTRVLQEAKPIPALMYRFKQQAPMIEKKIRDAGRTPESLVYLPLLGRKLFWTVVLDPVTAQVVTAIPLDPY
ncbi:MAG: pilus assembly protein [Rhodoferax sp.]|nr:pilus assembly protein [Rhodoferax sp.]